MTTLLLVRHGQSVANIQHVFAGHYDLPLSPLGEQQAEKTALYLETHFSVDAIYSSDLSRALGTAKATALLTGKEIVPMPALREIFAGEWEGKPFSQLERQFEQGYTVWKTDIGAAAPDGGETVAQMASRVQKAVREIAQHNQGKTVAVFTHATPIRVLQCVFSGKPVGQMKDIPWVSNASVTEITYDGGEFSLKTVGMDAHLGDLRSHLPKNV